MQPGFVGDKCTPTLIIAVRCAVYLHNAAGVM